VCVLNLAALCIAGSLRDSVMNGSVECVRHFLTAADIDVFEWPAGCHTDDNMTPVMLAARHGHQFSILFYFL